MKQIPVTCMVILISVGLLATSPLIHAEQPKPTVPVETQAQQDEVKWTAWRSDFEARLEADEKYATAKAAVEAHEADELKERNCLVAARNDRYREIARGVYEAHFGRWEGDDGEFDGLIAIRDSDSPIAVCSRAAVDTCGAGRICRVAVTLGENWSCSFSCGDAHGKCPGSSSKKGRCTTD